MKLILVLSFLACAALGTTEDLDIKNNKFPGGVVAGFAPETSDVQAPPDDTARLLNEHHMNHNEDEDLIDHEENDPVNAAPEPYTEWWEILLIIVGFAAGIVLTGLIILITITNIRK